MGPSNSPYTGGVARRAIKYLRLTGRLLVTLMAFIYGICAVALFFVFTMHRDFEGIQAQIERMRWLSVVFAFGAITLLTLAGYALLMARRLIKR